MIAIFKSTDVGLQPVETLADGVWVNLVDPSHADLHELAREYDIPVDFLTSPLDVHELARTEREDGSTLIVLRVPYYQGESSDIPYNTVPMGIVLNERVIITVSKMSNPIIEAMTRGSVRGLSTTKRNRFVLRLILGVAAKYLAYLREINVQVEALEDKLQKSLRNKELLDLLKYQKSLTYFTTALQSNDLMLIRLRKSRMFSRYEEDEELLEDALTEIGQAIAMTRISSDILTQMSDTFASIISNNLNVVMKFMTAMTIIIALPTLITSMYGMNITLPFMDAQHAFWGVLALSVLLAGGTLAFFWRKDWLL
jgi:magnesium transporter